MRQGRVIDESIRRLDPVKRDRIIDLIGDLANEVHATGLIRAHADPGVTNDWSVRGIETCTYPLCVDALATINDLKSVVTYFPLDNPTG